MNTKQMEYILELAQVLNFNHAADSFRHLLSATGHCAIQSQFSYGQCHSQF